MNFCLERNSLETPMLPWTNLRSPRWFAMFHSNLRWRWRPLLLECRWRVELHSDTVEMCSSCSCPCQFAENGNNAPTRSTGIVEIAVTAVLLAVAAVLWLGIAGIVALLVWCLGTNRRVGYKADLCELGSRRRHDLSAGQGRLSCTILGSSSAYGGQGSRPPPPSDSSCTCVPPPPLSVFSSSTSQSMRPPCPPHVLTHNSRSCFTYEELEAATDGFSDVNLLGEGGFGCVYKGYLPGRVVAVKKLRAGSTQGEQEFRAEVEIISRVHHRHLVALVGFCIADRGRLLAYDYVPNGTLEDHLHGEGRHVMDWPTRSKIAADVARGLAYLHEDCRPQIIHRNIKPSNILLDNNFEAQISDFGLANLVSDNSSHMSTAVAGTIGYLAPESGISEKTDVYSFGVLMWKLITGKDPLDVTPKGKRYMVHYLERAHLLRSQALEHGDMQALADKELVDYNENEMCRMIHVAAACVQFLPNERPTMREVVHALETDGVKPGQRSKHGIKYNIDTTINTRSMLLYGGLSDLHQGAKLGGSSGLMEKLEGKASAQYNAVGVITAQNSTFYMTECKFPRNYLTRR